MTEQLKSKFWQGIVNTQRAMVKTPDWKLNDKMHNTFLKQKIRWQALYGLNKYQ